jgi:hypothetical protein
MPVRASTSRIYAPCRHSARRFEALCSRPAIQSQPPRRSGYLLIAGGANSEESQIGRVHFCPPERDLLLAGAQASVRGGRALSATRNPRPGVHCPGKFLGRSSRGWVCARFHPLGSDGWAEVRQAATSEAKTLADLGAHLTLDVSSVALSWLDGRFCSPPPVGCQRPAYPHFVLEGPCASRRS